MLETNPRLGRSPGDRHGNALQYSFLESPMDRGAWWATVHRVAESDKTKATYHTCNREEPLYSTEVKL